MGGNGKGGKGEGEVAPPFLKFLDPPLWVTYIYHTGGLSYHPLSQYRTHNRTGLLQTDWAYNETCSQESEVDGTAIPLLDAGGFFVIGTLLA